MNTCHCVLGGGYLNFTAIRLLVSSFFFSMDENCIRKNRLRWWKKTRRRE